MKEILAVVNEEGRFIREFNGMTFDPWKLPNTNHPELGERTGVLLSNLYSLQQEFNSILELHRTDKISIMEREFKTYVRECRKFKDEVIELKSFIPVRMAEKNRLESAHTLARMDTITVKGNGPKPHDYPSDEEIAAWQRKVDSAVEVENNAFLALRECTSSNNLFEYEVNQKVEELKLMAAKHDAMLNNLNRAKGVNTQQESSGSNAFGLAG